MASLARKSVDFTVTGCRLALIASAPRGMAMAACRRPIITQMSSATFQQTLARLVSISSPLLVDSTTEMEIAVVPIEIVEHVIQEHSVLIDVRKPEEVNEFGRIPMSNLLPVDDIESALQLTDEKFRQTYHFNKPSRDALIITYCRSGKRAARAGAIFRDKFGYKNVVNYKGSWLEWAAHHPEDTKCPPR